MVTPPKNCQLSYGKLKLSGVCVCQIEPGKLNYRGHQIRKEKSTKEFWYTKEISTSFSMW
jgi:hypothetical protein